MQSRAGKKTHPRYSIYHSLPATCCADMTTACSAPGHQHVAQPQEAPPTSTPQRKKRSRTEPTPPATSPPTQPPCVAAEQPVCAAGKLISATDVMTQLSCIPTNNTAPLRPPPILCRCLSSAYDSKQISLTRSCTVLHCAPLPPLLPSHPSSIRMSLQSPHELTCICSCASRNRT